jgi:hypothetical protein
MEDNKVEGILAQRGIVLELKANSKKVDFSQIVLGIANGVPVDLSSYEVIQHNSIVDGFASEFRSYIFQHGLTSFLRRGPLTEALVAPGATPNHVQMLLHGYLVSLEVTTELVIVDPYFFARFEPGYPRLVKEVLQPILGALRSLTIVSLPDRVNALALSAVKNELNSNATHVNLIHRPSSVFHDRFWMNPISGRGFITGCSLNGLGRKYALMDHLESSDAAEVLAALRREQLL